MLEKLKSITKGLEEIIIIGGGASIKEGISLGLKDKLKDKFVIACNYAYKHFPHTLLACVDSDFYVPYYMQRKQNPDIYEELKKESLIITTANIDSKVLLPNTLIVKGSGIYNNNPIKLGFYNPILCGLFALHLAEYFEPKKIFLLGYDWNRRNPAPIDRRVYNGHTNLDIHYYNKEEIPHEGIGKIGFYENHLANQYFKAFNNSKCKIYNVSLNSNIENFEKITYSEFFNLQKETL